MAKFNTLQAQQEALRNLAEFEIGKAQAALRVEDPLELVKIEPLSGSLSENVTVISKTMVVDGDIDSDSPLSVKGRVNGNIVTTSDIGVNGLVAGNISADNISFDHAGVRGDSYARKDVSLGRDSVIIGDVEAMQMSIDGKVKGNLVVTNKVLFKQNSLLVGSVTAGGINMEDGARVNANITITNNEIAKIDENDFNLEV